MEMNKSNVDDQLIGFYRNQREWKAAGHIITDYTDAWESIAQLKLKDILAFYPAEHEAGPLRGHVLTREFEMHLAPFKLGDRVFTQVVVEVRSTRSTDPVEACRFLIDREGNYLNTAGEILISDRDSTPHMTFLCNLVDHVLRTQL